MVGGCSGDVRVRLLVQSYVWWLVVPC
jgi:hypothetical protein